MDKQNEVCIYVYAHTYDGFFFFFSYYGVKYWFDGVEKKHFVCYKILWRVFLAWRIGRLTNDALLQETFTDSTLCMV